MDFLLDDEPAPQQRPAFPPIDFRAQLNDEQFAAVTSPPGPVLVLAGAGSGKTRTLTYRVAYLLQELRARPDEILLLTFTNKAAKEMLARVEDLTGTDASRFWGGTFHHIGHRILRANSQVVGLERNFTILDADESEHLLRDVVDETDKGFFKDKANPKPSVLFSILSYARNTVTSVIETIRKVYPQHEHLTDRIVPFAAAYQKKKIAQQVADYDDLLEYWLEILQKAPALAEYYQRRFAHTLVDEYQDTNKLQARIVDIMGGNHQIMAVGDDAQCIYSWRGADFENILTFPDRHPGTTIHRIETNYRSSPEILQLANGVLQNQPRGRGFEKELRPARPSAGKPMLVPAMDTREQAAFITSRIRGLRDSGTALKDIAILYRAHYHALDIQLELARLEIPYQITSGVRFFEQAHVRDLVSILRFAYNPTDAMAFQRFIILLPKIGDKGAQKLHARASDEARKNKTDIFAVLSDEAFASKIPQEAKTEWRSLAFSLQQIAASIRDSSKNPSDAVDLAIEGWYSDYLRGAFPNYQSRLEDLKSLVGFAARFSDMQEMLAQIMLLNSETSDRKIDPDADALRLTTVHQAKGLEYDVVFLIGLGDGMFPLRRSIEAGDVEEERRLFYVAVTRARDELYLCYPRFVAGKGGPPMNATASRFIEELDDSLYEEVRIKPRWSQW